MPAKCLYAILGLESRDVEEDAIKKAYKRQALLWHPDKNAHRKEEAVERFKEIQNAYEVLSDKHERAWYDSHRDQILRSGDRHQAGAGAADGVPQRPPDEEDLFQYFTSAAYSGYGDGPKGFYGVYAELFERLAKQEGKVREERQANKMADTAAGSDDDEVTWSSKLPKFGSSQSTAAEVHAFYSEWSHFSTSKSFGWAELYNLASAPNRQVRRKMEEENRKARRAARREYNEAIRDLTAFVKKRDKRVAKFAAEEAAKRAKKAADEEQKRLAEKAERAARAAAYEEADWIKASEEVIEEESEEQEEQEFQTFYCVACDKRFKSEKQLKNHETSKKHAEMVAHLRAVLQAEEGCCADAEALLGSDLPAHTADSLAAEGADESHRGGRGKRTKRKQQQQRRQQQQREQKATASSGDEKGMRKDAGGASEAVPQEPGDQLLTTGKQQQQQQRQKRGAQEGTEADPRRGGKGADKEEEEEEADDDDEDALLARMVNTHARVGDGAGKYGPGPRSRRGRSGEESGEEDRASDGAGVCMEGKGKPGMDGGESSSRGSKAEEEEQEEGEEEEEEEDEDAMLARLVRSKACGPSPKETQPARERAAGWHQDRLKGRRGRRGGDGGRSPAAGLTPAGVAEEEGLSDKGGGESEAGTSDGEAEGNREGNRAGARIGERKGRRRGGGWAKGMLAGGEQAGGGGKRGAEPAAAPAANCANEGTVAATKRALRKAKLKTTKGEIADPLACKVCGWAFSSRTQLFKHIQETGHAALKA